MHSCIPVHVCRQSQIRHIFATLACDRPVKIIWQVDGQTFFLLCDCVQSARSPVLDIFSHVFPVIAAYSLAGSLMVCLSSTSFKLEIIKGGWTKIIFSIFVSKRRGGHTAETMPSASGNLSRAELNLCNVLIPCKLAWNSTDCVWAKTEQKEENSLVSFWGRNL